MNTFDNIEYELEVKDRFYKTTAFKEYEQRTVNHTKVDFANSAEGLNKVMKKFADCKADGNTYDSEKAQTLVKELQDYITSNFYTCNEEVLKGLGKMYVADERFKTNIDKHAIGTADFISKAIEFYCK